VLFKGFAMFDFLSQKFFSIFNSLGKEKSFNPKNMESALSQIREALLESDVPFAVVQTFVASVEKELAGQKITKVLKPEEQLVRVVYQKLVDFLGGESLTPSFQIPSVIMVMGLQGSGKTTSTAKLAHFVKNQALKRNKSRSILLGSVDFYRPAAVEQLEQLSKTIGCDFYRAQSKNVVEAAVELYERFKTGYEMLFLDTAGRLHVDTEMLAELKAIQQKLEPRYKLLVLDSMTGQESLSIASAFDAAVGFHAAILTKMDSDTRGGAAFAFRYALKKPIMFVGTGEKVTDLQEFFPERIAQRMLSMGDIQTLIEQADEKIKKSDQARMSETLFAGKLTLDDFCKQIDMVSQIGSLTQLVKYIPGMAHTLSREQLDAGEREIKKFRAIISSMTAKERTNTVLIDDSRKKRIAKGAGAVPADVTTLLERFEQAQQYAKLLKKSDFFKGLFR
jgi:signal recognition particle subunit SRP54